MVGYKKGLLGYLCRLIVTATSWSQICWTFQRLCPWAQSDTCKHTSLALYGASCHEFSNTTRLPPSSLICSPTLQLTPPVLNASRSCWPSVWFVFENSWRSCSLYCTLPKHRAASWLRADTHYKLTRVNNSNWWRLKQRRCRPWRLSWQALKSGLPGRAAEANAHLLAWLGAPILTSFHHDWWRSYCSTALWLPASSLWPLMH